MSVLQTPLTHQRRPARFIAFALIATLALGGLTTRLFAMQLAGSPAQQPDAALPAAVTGNQIVTEPVPSTRGLIYDRAKRPLVENVPTFTVAVRPADLPLSEQPQVVGRLAGLLNLSATTITETIDGASGSRFDPVTIAHDVPEQTARLISEDGLSLPGVEVTVDARRDYLDGPLFTQLIGWTGPIDAAAYASLKSQGYLPDDQIGKTGVESVYEAALRGVVRGSRDREGRDRAHASSVLATTTAPQAGDSLHPHDRRQGAADGAGGARLGPASCPGLKRGVDRRREPADRRDPRHGQRADVRREPVLAWHQHGGLPEAPHGPEPSAHEPRHHGHPATRVRLQAGHGHGRSSPTRSSA